MGETFGHLVIIDSVSRKCGVKEDELLTWEVARFYTKVRLYAWQAWAEKNYNKLMAASK